MAKKMATLKPVGFKYQVITVDANFADYMSTTDDKIPVEFASVGAAVDFVIERYENADSIGVSNASRDRTGRCNSHTIIWTMDGVSGECFEIVRVAGRMRSKMLSSSMVPTLPDYGFRNKHVLADLKRYVVRDLSDMIGDDGRIVAVVFAAFAREARIVASVRTGLPKADLDVRSGIESVE